MADPNIGRLEVEALTSLLHDGEKCLAVGCGDAAALIEIARARRLDLLCVDRSDELIRAAKRHSEQGISGRVGFAQADILTLGYQEAFDVVFTDRCLVGLPTWRDQKRALGNLARALRRGGRLILLEAFVDGLATLNAAREEIGLERVAPGPDALLLDADKTTSALTGCCVNLSGEHNFLSTYAFGSKILYPALARAGGQPVADYSLFVRYFSMLPALGNYSDTRILVFSKGQRHYD